MTCYDVLPQSQQLFFKFGGNNKLRRRKNARKKSHYTERLWQAVRLGQQDLNEV